jgi:hypothetical protein
MGQGQRLGRQVVWEEVWSNLQYRVNLVHFFVQID